MKNRLLQHFFVIIVSLITILSCTLPSSDSQPTGASGLESTKAAMEAQQTQMALGFQQTAFAMEQTKASDEQKIAQQKAEQKTEPQVEQKVEPSTSTPKPQDTYTPYPTYTTQPTELPQPSDTPAPTAVDIEARIRKANILVFEDVRGYPALVPWVSRAISGMDFSGGRVIEVGDAVGDFMSQLNSPTKWDAIVIAAEVRTGVRGEFFDVIMDQVKRKVGLVVELWYLDEIANGRIAPLLSKCGVEFEQDWSRDPDKYDVLNYSLYWLDQQNPVFTTPNIVAPLTTPVIYWTGDAGDIIKLGAGGDATLLAGLHAREKSRRGTLATCMEGRMILQTFSTHDYRQSQVIPLWQNYIYNVLAAHFKAVP